MAVDGIIFGGMIYRDSSSPLEKLNGITYSSVRRHAGSHRIATFLRQHGLNIEVVDFMPSWTFEEFKELIKSRVTSNTKFVGLGTIFDMNTEEIRLCFSWLKLTYPEVLVITGSMGFSNINTIPADYMVVGYGELAILEILKGTAKYKKEIVKEQTVKIVHALHNYPAYPMSNLSIDYEKRDFLQSFEPLTIETSRGCRFKCAFCTYPVLGVKTDHTRTSEDFRDNLIRNYDNYGIYRYSVADETFNDYSEKIIKYADAVEKLSFEPNFGGYIRPDLLHTRPGDIEHLARMRFTGQFYGIESFNRPSAAAIGKGMEPSKIQQAILDTKNYFLRHNGCYKGTISLIIGLPHETQDTLNETLRWCRQNWQNQHINFLPLVISLGQQYDRVSTLTGTYEKQGYTRIEQNEIDLSDVQPWIKPMFESYFKDTSGALRWKSNTGMTEKDALNWMVSVRSSDDYMDYGVDHWRMDDWYVCGKTDQDLQGSYRTLGGIYSPQQPKIDFIEDYKKKKLNYNV